MEFTAEEWKQKFAGLEMEIQAALLVNGLIAQLEAAQIEIAGSRSPQPGNEQNLYFQLQDARAQLAALHAENKRLLSVLRGLKNRKEHSDNERVKLINQLADARKALEVLKTALNDGEGGNYWPARKFLDERDIYHGDLNDLRVLHAVVKAALEQLTSGKEEA